MFASCIKPFWRLVFGILIHICIAIMHQIYTQGLSVARWRVLQQLAPSSHTHNFWRQVADLEMKLHQNDCIDIHLKLLVFSFRILLPCSCVPTSWTRKTFLASRTPSWFSIGVMRTEREWVHSGWTHTTTYVFDLLLHTAMPQKLYQYVEL